MAATGVKKQSTLQLCVRKTRSSSKRMKENAVLSTENQYKSNLLDDQCISPEKRRRLFTPLSPLKSEENQPHNSSTSSAEKRRRLFTSILSPTKSDENRPNDCSSISPEKRRRLISSLSPTKFEGNVPTASSVDDRRIPFSPVKVSVGENERNKCSTEPNRRQPHISRLCFEKDVNVYQEAKVALSSANNLKLYCREHEIDEITKFLNEHLDRVKAGSLYISGAPGTGKTACIEFILKTRSSKAYKLAHVNCANLNNSKNIYDNIWEQLKFPKSFVADGDYCKALEKKITAHKTPIVIILDEIDYLENKNQSILYRIFEWPSLENSKLILIGLANALDLTTRVLPRLQSIRCKCKPHLLHFQPYTKEQISLILQERLKLVSSDNGIIFKPMAIEFCARKISSVAGDIRKALDVCRRAVEILEADIFQKNLKLPTSAPADGVLAESKANPITCVDVPLVVSILNEVYGNSLVNRGDQSDENALPLQQRILLCTLLLIQKNIKTKEITLGKFGDVFSRVCIQHQANKMDQAEFVSICNLLESRGLLRIKYNKDIRQSKVCLRVNESEIEFALGDKLLLSSILRESGHLVNKR